MIERRTIREIVAKMRVKLEDDIHMLDDLAQGGHPAAKEAVVAMENLLLELEQAVRPYVRKEDAEMAN